MTLAEFVAARLDETEALAKAAASVAGPAWRYEHAYLTGTTVLLLSEDGAPLADMLGGGDELPAHISLHDPSRVLREVAAKRKILAAYTAATAYRADAARDFSDWAEGKPVPLQPPSPQSPWTKEVPGLEFAVRALAAAWSDHPGYDPGWRG